MNKRLVITPGEPAGIGPDITIQMAQQPWDAELVVIADPDLLAKRAKCLDLPLQLQTSDPDLPPGSHTPGSLKIIPVRSSATAEPGSLNTKNADYVIRTLETAASLCMNKKADAIVTGPVHKGVINKAGIAFTGHTEFFAQYCGVQQTVMLFVVDGLKVALATTHIPLSSVSQAVTKELLDSVVRLLHDELKQKFRITAPHILICGLNPHAGEGGYLGREEIDTIAPAVRELCAEHYSLEGPLPADTIFTRKYLQRADAILAMYHDQALPLVKYIGFGHAVNVTLGLPFVRTSVDHGTAIDIAGTKHADAGSMIAAARLAISLG
jgi:4-hydroxythreonine-4-phosphate dehydrogenase